MEIIFLIGRILLGGFFVVNGYSHFTKTSMMTPMVKAKGLPMPELLVYLTGAQITLGGLSLIFGVYPQVGSWLLIVFLLLTAFSMHDFWKAPPDMKMIQMLFFMRNIALTGALLMISTIQSWPLSLQLPY